MINRGNCRMKIFRKTEDCMAFMRLMEQVNEPIEKEELNRLRVHVQHGRPYGDARWTAQAVKRMGLEWTIRERGRPPRTGRSKTARRGKAE